MMKTIAWILAHRKSLKMAFFSLSAAFLLSWGIVLHKQNKKLSESLEMALNNIEAYLGMLSTSLLALNVLKLDFDELQYQNDSILQKLDSVRKELKIKPKQITTAATQTLVIDVNISKGVGGLAILKDTVYSDTIQYNPLTTISYTIGKDTIDIGLDIKNEQYLFVYTSRQYKHDKKFLKRLFTWDFKKVIKYKYDIINSNDVIQTTDVRVVEANK